MGTSEVRTGRHFGQVVRSPAALIGLVLTLVVIAIGGIAAEVSTALLAAAGAVVLLIWLLVVIVVAGQRAREAFYEAYAGERKLSWSRDQPLPPATPLLRMGDAREADEHFSGQLPGGLDGTLALYTYTKRSTDSNSEQVNEYHHFTVALAEIPESRSRIPSLYCQRRVGFQFLDGAEDVFRRTKRIELESAKLDDRCEIFAHPDCDDNWLRQLFSPSFVVFLAEDTPEGFAFEVEDGILCVNRRNHAKKARELDSFCEHAGSVAQRLREELAEG